MKDKNSKIIKSFRHLKISSMIKKRLSELFLDMNDKRVGIITINEVLLSKDLRYAKVYVFFLNNLSIKNTMLLLNKCVPYLRNKLSSKLSLNFIPKINFYYDKSIIINNRIDKLLNNNIEK